MTRNSDDLKKEFGNSWEKETGITYDRWLENEIRNVENEKEKYQKLTERLSFEVNRLASNLKIMTNRGGRDEKAR